MNCDLRYTPIDDIYALVGTNSSASHNAYPISCKPNIVKAKKKIRENDEENNRFPKILWRFIHMKIEEFAKSRK